MWQQTAILQDFCLGIYGKACLFRTPKSYGEYTFFHPAKLVKIDCGYCIITFNDNWTWKFSKKIHSEYVKKEINVTEFLSIWPTASDYIYHKPDPLTPEKIEVLKELSDVE